MIATVESSLTIHSCRLKNSLVTKGGHALATIDTTNAVATPGIDAKCLHMSLTSATGSQLLSTANFYVGYQRDQIMTDCEE